VDDVRTFALRSMADWPAALAEVGLPAVVKPVRGAGSRHTHPLLDRAQATELLAEIFTELGHGSPAPPDEPQLIVEELLRGRPSLPFGDYVSVESLCASGEITHLAVSGKPPLVPPFRETGRFWPTHLPEPEQRTILDLVSRALRALNVRHGLTHTELKLTPSGPRIIEVNGRLGGHLNGLARTACGVDLVQVAARHALGEHQDLPYLRPAKVHFQHNGLAPTQPCRLLGVHGAPEVRRIPGISGYRTFARIGADLPGGVRTHELDVIWGVADTSHAMVELLSTALSTLEYEFQFADGVRRMPAADCGAWAASLTKGAS
jgi:biotin carboxylase